MIKHRHSKKHIPADTPCGYCFQEWATTWDHIKPISQGGDNREDNLYPACRRCNSLLQDHTFPTMEERREWVRNELINRNEWL